MDKKKRTQRCKKTTQRETEGRKNSPRHFTKGTASYLHNLSISKHTGSHMYLHVGVGVHISDLLFWAIYFARTRPLMHTQTHITAAVRLVRPDSLAAPALYLPQTIHLRRGGCLSVCVRVCVWAQHNNTPLKEGTWRDVEPLTALTYRCVCRQVRQPVVGLGQASIR